MVPPDHQRDQPVDRTARSARLADDAAVAQHRDVVAEAHHVAEDVADVDDRDALGLEPADEREEALGLAGGERGRRLVEDDDARLGAQRLRDLDQLPLALAEGGSAACRAGVEARRRPAARAPGRATLRRSMNGRPRTSFGKPPMKRFSSTVRLLEEVQLLVDERDARRPRRPWARAARRPGRRASSARTSGWWTPPRMFIVVDLPEPFSPTRPMTSPGCEREADLVQHADAEEALASAPRAVSSGAVIMRATRRWRCASMMAARG